jgi:hypothetical protein
VFRVPSIEQYMPINASGSCLDHFQQGLDAATKIEMSLSLDMEEIARPDDSDGDWHGIRPLLYGMRYDCKPFYRACDARLLSWIKSIGAVCCKGRLRRPPARNVADLSTRNGSQKAVTMAKWISKLGAVQRRDGRAGSAGEQRMG